MNVNAIILAGGKSSRMGEDKGLMLLGDRPMISHIIDALKPLSTQMMIVSNNPEYEQFGTPVHGDMYLNKGPLAGIYTGLFHSDLEYNIVVSCDTPHISGHLLRYVMDHAEGFDVSIPVHKGGTEQLMGVYAKPCLPVFKDCLESDRLKIKEASKLTRYQEIQIDEQHEFYDPKIFMNVNSQEDFQNLRFG